MRFLVIIILVFPFTLFGQVTINEFLASNDEDIIDYLGNHSDWIELYNDADTSVNLLGWTINDDNNNSDAWHFPSVVIPSKGFLLVFAAGDSLFVNGFLHADFKLDADGEEIALWNTDNQVMDYINYSVQLEDVSFGRSPDGTASFYSFQNTSPGATNQLTDTLVNYQVSLSHPSGFYDDEVVLSAAPAPNNGVIRYSLDGSLPSNESPELISLSLREDNVKPITIAQIPTGTGWHFPKDVSNTHVLTAQAFIAGEPYGQPVKQIYFIGQNWKNKYAMPIVSLVTEPTNLYDLKTGIYIVGDDENYYQRGRASERPVQVDFFDTEGDLVFSQDAGARIFGGTSRLKPQKSLKLFARKSYGKASFDHAFFGDDYDDEFQRLVLRSLITDWGPSAMTDDVIQEIVHQGGVANYEYVRRSYCIVFINGEYWGVHSLREDFNDEYIERKFGIDEDDVEVNGTEFGQLFAFIENKDLKDASNYSYVESRLDIPAFISYMTTEILFANIDWPRGNYGFWREKEVGKWRPIFFDLDGACKVYNENLLQQIHEIQRFHSPVHEEALLIKVLGSLMEQKSFRDAFIVEMIANIQYYYTPDFTTRVQADLIETLAPEMEEHIDRWGYPSNFRRWESATDKVKNFLFMRPEWMFGLVMDLFDYPLDIFPNPIVNSKFTMSIEMPADEMLNLALIDMNQQYTSIGSYEVLKGSNELDITIPSVPSGIYVLSIEGESMFHFEKIVIE